MKLIKDIFDWGRNFIFRRPISGHKILPIDEHFFITMIQQNCIFEEMEYGFFDWRKNEVYVNKIKYLIGIPFFSLVNGAKYIDFFSSYFYSVCWNVDTSSGYVFNSSIYYKYARKIVRRKQIEVKYPWEISRMHHLLFHAIYKSNDEGKDFFMRQFVDFYLKNPYKLGINWACTMDVSIRALNFLLSFLYLKSKDIEFSNKEEKLISSILWDYANFIYENPEKSGQNGNHYLTNVSVLLILSLYFDNAPEAWLRFSVNEFVSEIDNQFNDDGTFYENSTAYHRLATEIIFYTYLLTYKLLEKKILSDLNLYNKNRYLSIEKVDKCCFSKKEFYNLFFKAYVFLKATSKPDKSFHQIGDNDSGRFLIFDFAYKKLFKKNESCVDIRNTSYTLQLQLSSFLMKERQFLEEPCFFTRSIFDLKNGLVLVNIERIECPKIYEKLYYRFDDFGLYIIQGNGFYLGFRCGGKGGKYSHAHEDLLSFDLTINGKNIFIDKGSYTYTQYPNLRNLFRSQYYHNVPLLQNFCQANLDKSLFGFEPIVKSKLVRFVENEMSGMLWWKDKIIIRRILLDSSGIQIEDYTTIGAENLYENNFSKINELPYSAEYGIMNNL